MMIYDIGDTTGADDTIRISSLRMVTEPCMLKANANRSHLMHRIPRITRSLSTRLGPRLDVCESGTYIFFSDQKKKCFLKI